MQLLPLPLSTWLEHASDKDSAEVVFALVLGGISSGDGFVAVAVGVGVVTL